MSQPLPLRQCSAHEQRIISHCAAAYDTRLDGRGASTVRSATLETDVLPSAAGSARVRLRGGTDVVAGVKADLVHRRYWRRGRYDGPDDSGDGDDSGGTGPPANNGAGDERQARPSRPVAEADAERGSVSFAVELCGVANPEFEGRGAEALAVELTSLLERAYEPAHAFLRALCAARAPLRDDRSGDDESKNNAPRRAKPSPAPAEREWACCCWNAYVDVLVLGTAGGNVYDAVSYAVRAALATTIVPAVVPSQTEAGTWEIDDNPDRCAFVDASAAPTSVTAVRLGRGAVGADDDEEEEEEEEEEGEAGEEHEGDVGEDRSRQRERSGADDNATLKTPNARRNDDDGEGRRSAHMQRTARSEHRARRPLLLDPLSEEESCMDARMTASIISDGSLCALHKSGTTSVSVHALTRFVRAAVRSGARACRDMDKYIADTIAAEEDDAAAAAGSGDGGGGDARTVESMAR